MGSTEDEWYKAAYYDPTKGGPGGYWLHANQSNSMSGNTIGVAGTANYWDGDFVGYPDVALTDVGAYGANSDSFYGTNDQAGNVWEWNAAAGSGPSRGDRGGAFGSSHLNMGSNYSTGPDPSHQDCDLWPW